MHDIAVVLVSERYCIKDVINEAKLSYLASYVMLVVSSTILYPLSYIYIHIYTSQYLHDLHLLQPLTNYIPHPKSNHRLCSHLE